MMESSANALVRLLRFALESDAEYTLPSEIDWQKLVDLSFDQGVAALAVDGLQKFYGSNPDVEIEIDKEELEDLKYEWFGEVLRAEGNYQEHCSTVKTICQTYAQNGFRPILLKGLGLSLNYPIPAHRLCGDLDIFLADGKSLEGDLMIMEKLGLEVTKRKAGHHSHYSYNGLSVENHYELSNPYSGGEKARRFERELQTLIASGAHKPSVDSSFYLPSVNFNAVFLFWHLGSHFCFGGINLKQLCDLLMFLKQHHSGIDWPLVQRIWKQYGMVNFAYAIGSLMVKYFAMPVEMMPGMIYDETMAVRIMDDIITGNKEPPQGLSRILKYPCNAWKFRLVTGRSWIFPMLDSLWLHIAHSGDLKEKGI